MKIGLVIYKGGMPSGLYAFADVLEGVNKFTGKRIFEFNWIFADKNSSDKLITNEMSDYPQTRLSDDSLDALLIAGFWSETTEKINNMLIAQQNMISDLKKYHSRTPIYGFCSSVCLLAESGILDGQLATSTWWLANFLQENYQNVNWNFSQNIISNQYNITAAGWLGYVRVAQDIVVKNCDTETYSSVADLLLLAEPVKIFEPFSQLKWVNFEDELLKKVYRWVITTPAKLVSIKGLAETFNLTEKTISRKVKDAANISAADFLRQIKLQQAAVQLITGHKSIAQISNELGYSNDASFRRSFIAVTKSAPNEFRKKYANKM
jgi:transcriptional regulator GlxA family with amidase domain